MSVSCQQAILQAWLEMKETANRGARLDELLRVVRVEPIAEQCRTLASIAAAARDDRGLDDLVPGGVAALDESRRQCPLWAAITSINGASAGCHAVRHVGDRSDFRIGDSRSASRRTARSAGRSAISFCNSTAAWATSLSSMA